MIILDTDHCNILQIGRGPAYETLAARISDSLDQHFSTTAITLEEHLRGWLAGIRRARDISQEVRPYDQLINLVRFFQAWEILRFARTPQHASKRCGRSVCGSALWT